MTKKEKIDYVNSVYLRFQDARNHGHNGHNWWYPKPNVIAYNVKMHGASKDIEDIRKHMTERQNKYYSDDTLYEISQEQLWDEARMFSDDLDIEYGLTSGYAGRSGGWLEVEYKNDLSELGDDSSIEDVNYFYKEAQKLEKLETEVSEKIKKAHKSLMVYMNTEQYCLDFVERLSDDEEIGEIYKSKAKDLLDKLN
jgi:hypothetical protein